MTLADFTNHATGIQPSNAIRVMIFGVGAFAHAMMAILKDKGAETACYLTRDYGHYGPSSVGKNLVILQSSITFAFDQGILP